MSSLPSPGALDTNPFSDDHSRSTPGRVPYLPRLSAEQMKDLGENIDTVEELEWGRRKCAERESFLQRFAGRLEARDHANNTEGMHSKY